MAGLINTLKSPLNVNQVRSYSLEVVFKIFNNWCMFFQGQENMPVTMFFAFINTIWNIELYCIVLKGDKLMSDKGDTEI